MNISIKDNKESSQIKIDDKELTNVSSYSISSDASLTTVTLVFKLPKNNVSIKADY